MQNEKPVVTTENAHYLKSYASWLYCDHCNKTIAYLCYVTYRYFRISFTCACGCTGFAENRYEGAVITREQTGKLACGNSKRYCCVKDDSPLFSLVTKNLVAYKVEVVCKACGSRYGVEGG